MKVILTILILISVSLAAKAIVAKGRLIQPISSTRPSTDFCKSSTNLFKRYCNGNANDICSSTGFVFCNRINSGVLFPCSSSAPFCVEDSQGQAQCSQTSTCAPQQNDFVCLDEGIMPDPLDCKRYYYCYRDSSVGFAAQQFECPDLYVFDPSLSTENPCRLTYNQNCVTSKCQNSYSNMLLSYPSFPRALGQIGVTCMGENNKPVVFRCRANFLANLNTLPVQCELQCRNGLKAPYPGDDQKYFDCYYDGRSWTPRVISCFKNYYFNASSLKCELSPYTTLAPTEVPVTNAPTDAPTTVAAPPQE